MYLLYGRKRLLYRKSDGEIYDNVKRQLAAEKERIYKKHPDSLITAYFQANTNTYAPVATLKEAYTAALDSGVHGISIGTRADCLPDDVIALLCDINSKTHLTVELGLQTVHDKRHKSSTDATAMTSFRRATVNCKNPAYAPVCT